MRAKELVQSDLITIRDDIPIEEAWETFILEHISGAPVVDRNGRLIGIVTQEDIFFGQMTLPESMLDAGAEESPDGETDTTTRVRDVMTSPAIHASEDTPLEELAALMWHLRLHRIPIVRHGRVTGIVSSMDVCRVISQGRVFPRAVSY